MIGNYIQTKTAEDTAAKVNSYLVVDAKAMFDTFTKGVFVVTQARKTSSRG